MDTTSTATQDPAVDIDKLMNDFEKLLIDSKKPRGPLWYAWHYLQVYSTWGLRLPNTEATLKLKLSVPDPGVYLFFSSMLEAYQELHDASQQFLDKIFSAVVGVGDDLQAFASQASKDGDAIFSAVNDLLDANDTASVLELLENLQATAAANAKNAADVTSKLDAYKSQLVDADGKLAAVQDKVEADDKTSKATLDMLASTDPAVTDSLAGIQKLLTAKQDEYQQDVIIAATTPTYCWVFWPVPPFPAGLIAAITVASIYGSRAVQALHDADDLSDKLKVKSQELHTALAAHGVQQTALSGLGQAKTHTDNAIQQTTVLQNSWNTMATQIGVIKSRVDGMTREQDQDKILAAKAVIKIYASAAEKAWDKILPALTELTADPYISVESNEMSLSEFAAKVQQEIDRQTKSEPKE